MEWATTPGREGETCGMAHTGRRVIFPVSHRVGRTTPSVAPAIPIASIASAATVVDTPIGGPASRTVGRATDRSLTRPAPLGRAALVTTLIAARMAVEVVPITAP